MKANLNKSFLEAISLNDTGKNCNTIFSVRELLGIERFLAELTKAINKKTNNLISKIELINEKKNSSVLDSFDRGLYLHLRVFQENLMLIFPPELVIELTSNIIQQKEYPILSDITLKEITALSYLVVYLLVREKIFISQRIYLVGANYVAKHFAQEELSDKINLEQAVFFKLKFKLQELEYEVALVISEKILSRIKSHLRLIINKTALNKNITLYFNLEFKFFNLPVSSLMTIKAAEVIELNRINPHWYLRLLNGDGQHSTANVPIQCTSLKGRKGLQFKLS